MRCIGSGEVILLEDGQIPHQSRLSIDQSLVRQWVVSIPGISSMGSPQPYWGIHIVVTSHWRKIE